MRKIIFVQIRFFLTRFYSNRLSLVQESNHVRIFTLPRGNATILCSVHNLVQSFFDRLLLSAVLYDSIFYFFFRDIYICINAQTFVFRNRRFFSVTGVHFPNLLFVTKQATSSVPSVLPSVLFFSEIPSRPASSLGSSYRVAHKNWGAAQFSWMLGRPASSVVCFRGVARTNCPAALV